MSGVNVRDEVIRVKQIEDAIIAVSEAIKSLQTGRLNDNALLVLLKAACGKIPTRDIKRVLTELEKLEETYLKKETV